MVEERVSVTIAERIHVELKIASARRRKSMQDILGEAVALYLKIPPDKLDEVRTFVAQWNPGKRRSKQKQA